MKMNKIEQILSVIENNSIYSTVCYNTEEKQIQLDGKKIINYQYTELYNICRTELPDTKFTKTDVKETLEKYAHEHSFTPEKKNREKTDWFSLLDCNKDGKPKNTLTNTLLFLENYPLYKGKFSFNEWTQTDYFDGKEVDDHLLNSMCEIHDKILGFSSFDRINQSVSTLCYKNKFNPFKSAIESYIWDGEERASTLFIDKLGAEDTELNRSLTEKWLYAMIKRLYEPGCAFDNMLIVYDETQGTGKSKIIERLVHCTGVHYGVDNTITYDLTNKDIIDKLNKSWIVSIDELSSFLKAEPEKSKTFISCTYDTARLSYARRSQTFYRHCVFYGSSNVEYFLKDYTSDFERRYWILDCNGTPRDSKWWKENLSDEYLQQILAEMYYKYKTDKEFNYNYLSVEEVYQLKKVQFRHKTLNADDILIDGINSILNTQTDVAKFDSYEQFESALNGTIMSNLNSDIFNEVNNIQPTSITCIPITWFKRYLMTTSYMRNRRDISTQYLSSIMSTLGYLKVKTKYNGKTTNCYKKR